jgi:hypothetical protein
VGLDPNPAPYHDFRVWVSALPQAGCRIGNPSDSTILVAQTPQKASLRGNWLAKPDFPLANIKTILYRLYIGLASLTRRIVDDERGH